MQTTQIYKIILLYKYVNDTVKSYFKDSINLYTQNIDYYH